MFITLLINYFQRLHIKLSAAWTELCQFVLEKICLKFLATLKLEFNKHKNKVVSNSKMQIKQSCQLN